MIEHYMSEDFDAKMPKLVKDIISDDSMGLATAALGNVVKYLENLKIVEKIIPLSKFYCYTHEGSEGTLDHSKNMILDAQALDNLDIFEVQLKSKKVSQGSLYEFINHCVTKFGVRLLRRWLCSPLNDAVKLTQRHDAVEELLENYNVVKSFRKEFTGLYDLEKFLTRIYKYSTDQESRALYVNIDLVQRLTEFYQLLSQLESTVKKLDTVFGKNRDKVKSERLKSLISYKSIDTGDDKEMEGIYY